MSALAYDTMKAVEHFQKRGFSEEQAKAVAEHNAEIFGEKMATKEDLQIAVDGLRKDIEGVKKDMTINMGAIMAGGIVLIIATMGFLSDH